MKIVVLVESLTFGGAERQACVLAGEFKRRGHEVCVATYHPDNFYGPLLARESVEHRFLGGHGKASWALNIRRFLRTHGQDVVLAFLPGPSAYAELAGLPRRTWGLVVSERSAGVSNGLGLKANLHKIADCVVTNSHSARTAIGRRSPRLQPKLVTIYNAVEVELGRPDYQATTRWEGMRMVVAARLDRNKNPQGLLTALQFLKASQPSLRLRVDWYGDQRAAPQLLRETQKRIIESGLDDALRLHPPTSDIHDEMAQADAVLLASFFEGLPNAVCEGMILGRPILMSDVCDARNLVQDGVNGYLFDPRSPESIATTMAGFAGLTPEERARMGKAGRAKAEVLFDADTVADRYLRVLEAAARRQAIKMEHWPPQVPAETYA